MEEVLKEPEKLCINCGFRSYDGFASWCSHPANQIIGYSYVTGKPYYRGETWCELYRDKEDRCGPEGKYWKPIPPKPLSWWRKLFQ